MKPSVLVFVPHDQIKDLKYARIGSGSNPTFHKISDIQAVMSKQHLDIGRTMGVKKVKVQARFGGIVAEHTFELGEFLFINLCYKAAVVDPVPTWSFTNAAAREAPATYVKDDIGEIAFQLDDESSWELVSYETEGSTTTPTWKAFSIKKAELAASIFTYSPMLFFAPYGLDQGTYSQNGFNFYASGPDPVSTDGRAFKTSFISRLIVDLPGTGWRPAWIESYRYNTPIYARPGILGFQKMTTNYVQWELPVHNDTGVFAVDGGPSPDVTEADIGRVLEQELQDEDANGVLVGMGIFYHWILRNHSPKTWQFLPTGFPNDKDFYSDAGIEFLLE